MIPTLNLRTVVGLLLLLALLLLPLYVELTGSRFLLTLFTRIVILALAAVSLNLILGYGGMMSFGHAAYLGIGGYAVGILAFEGITSGFVQWPVALLVSAFFALRDRGAQPSHTRDLFYHDHFGLCADGLLHCAGLARYGGDDGLTIQKRSQFIAPINLSNKVQFYYICLVLLCAAISWCGASSTPVLEWQSRVRDRMIRACARSAFQPYRYQLICFVIAGTLCGLAGALLANHTDFVSPAMMYWTAFRRSHHHGCARWNGLHLRPIVRRSGAARAGRGALGHHRILADHPRAAAAFGRSLRARRHRWSAGKAPHG
jgi:branched-chain amino acid transport system permease protein